MCAAIAPWALASGMVVSFTASAGQDPDSGFSAVRLDQALAPLAPGKLVPDAPDLARANLQVPGVRIWFADIDPPGSLPSADPSPGTPPRADLKMTVHAYPRVLRADKGDPLAAISPSMSRYGLSERIGSRPALDPQQIAFVRNERVLPPTIMMHGSLKALELSTASSLTPWDDSGTTLHSSAPASPGSPATAMTFDPTRPPDAVDGATPPVPRAVTLASTTPAPADAVPVQIAAAPVSLAPDEANTSIADKDAPGQPDYAALIDPGHMGREERCLAEAVYFEARGEPPEGQAAVAQVVLNRVKSGLYPRTVCGVVFQNRNRYHACQFSFACEGRSLRISEPVAWKRAVQIARQVTQGKVYVAEVGGATHYHADYVRPYWARKLKKMDVIGRHIFYKLRPGQT